MTERVKYQGKYVDPRLLEIIKAGNRMLAMPRFGREKEDLTIVQGSWSGAAASAGTHTGSGAMDITAFNYKNRVKVFRLLGMAFYYRPTLPGVWNAHCHGIVDGDKGAAPSAQRQVVAYHNRRDALAGNGPDTGYRMIVFPKFVRGFTEEDGIFYVKSDVKVYEQPTEASRTMATLKSGFKFNAAAEVKVDNASWVISTNGMCVRRSALVKKRVEADKLNNKLPLKEGDRGWLVKRLQRGLKQTPTGTFTRENKLAVRKFQRDNGLVVDGIVGEQTAFALARLGCELRNINREKPAKGLQWEQAHMSLQFSDSIDQLKKDLYTVMNADKVKLPSGRRLSKKPFEIITLTEVGSKKFWETVQKEAAKYNYAAHKAANTDTAVLVHKCFMVGEKFTKTGGVLGIRGAQYWKDVHNFGPKKVTTVRFDSTIGLSFSVGAVHYLVQSRYDGMSQKLTPGCTINHYQKNREFAEAFFKWAWHEPKDNVVLGAGDYNMLFSDKKNHPSFGLPFQFSNDILRKYPNTGHGCIDGCCKLKSDKRFKPVRVVAYNDKKVPMFSDHFLTVTTWETV